LAGGKMAAREVLEGVVRKDGSAGAGAEGMFKSRINCSERPVIRKLGAVEVVGRAEVGLPFAEVEAEVTEAGC
jgi:hypothetical protein